MRLLRPWVLCALAFVMWTVSLGFAQQASIPNLIRYSGTLKDAQGAAISSSTMSVTFAIYRQQDGGAPVWLETQSVTTDDAGNFNALLGVSEAAGLPADLFASDEQRWLGVQAQGEAEQARVLLVSVPYALKAHDAETLGGLPASAFLQANASGVANGAQEVASPSGPALPPGAVIGGDGLANYIPLWRTFSYLQSSVIYQDPTTNNIGIGTTTPGATLDVEGNVKITGSGHGLTFADNSTQTTAELQGPQGPPGPQGPQGQTGPMGPQGPQGPQGDQGPAGSNGTNGQGFAFRNTFDDGTNYNAYDVVTYNGSTYDATVAIPSGGGTPDQNSNWALMAQVGAQGQQGTQGPAGPQGPQGQTGGTGPQGPQGLQGATGPQGPIGPQGDQGPAGSNGTNGQGFTFRNAFDNGTNYNPYDVVTYSGSTYDATSAIPAGGGTPDQNPNWSLMAQVGAQGQTGAAGPQGPQGIQGATGPQGPQGDQGPQGIPGNMNPGSPYYIQNGTSQQTSASFNIDGSGAVGGTLTATAAINTSGAYQIGGNAILQAPTGQANPFVGNSAGAANSSGVRNTFVGDNAGHSNTTANNNVFVGRQSGKANTTGAGGTFVGYQAGSSNTTAPDNTFIGNSSGMQSTGNGDTFVGAETGSGVTTGANNTFLGEQAGSAITTGGSDILIGNVGGTATESNTIRIGTQGTGFDQQNTIYIAGINSTTIPAGNPVYVDSNGMLGIGSGGGGGVTSFNGRTGDVVPAVNDYSFSLLSGTLGSAQLTGSYSGAMALTNSGSGENNTIRIGTQGAGAGQQNATYIAGITNTTISGGNPVYVDSSGKLGVGSGGGSGVTSFNGRSGAVVPAAGDYSFSLLSGTLADGQLSGSYSSALTLSNASNSFAGNGAGLTNVNAATLGGLSSTGFIQNSTTQQAGANFNISGTGTAKSLTASSTINAGTPLAPGVYQVGGSNVLADYLVSLYVGVGAGQEAQLQQAPPEYNAFFGDNAGESVTTAGNSTIIGSGAGPALHTGGYNVILGYHAGGNLVSGNSNLYLASNAGSATESNTIRIGTQGNREGQQNTTYITGISGATSSSGIDVLINSSGLLGTTTSSRRFKDDITDMGEASSKLFQLRPVTFFYKPQYDDGSHLLQYGLIAEEVAKIYPDLVVYGEDGQPQTIRYHLLTPMLLNELQKQHRQASEQQEIIKNQQEQITAQQENLTAALEKVSAQQQDIEALRTQNAEFQQRPMRLETLVSQQLATAKQ